MNDLGLDQLREIIVRLDHPSMGALFSTTSSLRTSLLLLDSDAEFWYRRSEMLAKQKLEERKIGIKWRYIYYVLLAVDKHFSDLEENNRLYRATEGQRRYSGDTMYSHMYPNPHRYGIEDPDAMRVLIEVYGVPNWKDGQKNWETRNKIANVSVLKLLLSLDSISPSSHNLIWPIKNNIVIGDQDAILDILTLAPDEDEEKLALLTVYTIAEISDVPFLEEFLAEYPVILDSNALSHSTRNKNEEMFEYVLSQVDVSDEEMLDMAKKIVEMDVLHVNTLNLILDTIKPNQDQMLEIYQVESYNNDVSVISALVQHGMVLNATKWRSILNEGLRDGKIDKLKLALAHISPATKTNQALILASRHTSMFELLLADPRTDPRVNLLAILGDITQKNARLLAKHPRIDLEELDTKTLSALYDACGITLDKDELLTSSDSYHQILRYLVFKRPSSLKLISWLIGRRSRTIVEAADSVMNDGRDYGIEVASIRALLLCLLYPSVTFEEQMQYLAEENYDSDMLAKSALLIKSYLNM